MSFGLDLEAYRFLGARDSNDDIRLKDGGAARAILPRHLVIYVKGNLLVTGKHANQTVRITVVAKGCEEGDHYRVVEIHCRCSFGSAALGLHMKLHPEAPKLCLIVRQRQHRFVVVHARYRAGPQDFEGNLANTGNIGRRNFTRGKER